MKRRGFLGLSAIGSVALMSGACTNAANKANEAKKESEAVLKLSCQEGVAPGESLSEKLDFMEEHGFSGIEPWGGGLANRVDEYQKALANRSIEVSAVCAGFEGYLIAVDPQERKKAMKSMKEILEAAGALGSTGLIIVPAFNNQESLPHKESREILIDQLQELGEYAKQLNTYMLLEPLNMRETYFLRQLADAAAIARDTESDGVGVMGDFWHMTWEETSDMGAIISAADYLQHMHIASRQNRRMPGEDENDNYIDGFKALKYIDYQKYISFECWSDKDHRIVIPKAVKLIREQWEMA
jgi:sugar phosphate isomerase/epimerase